VLIGSENAPLMEQAAADSVENVKARLAWSGSNNLYEGIRTFWKIDAEQDRLPVQEMMGATAWQDRWDDKDQPSMLSIPSKWLSRLDDNPRLYEHLPRDYKLPSEMGDIGAHLDDLPSLPHP
jgi:hypothetical protein